MSKFLDLLGTNNLANFFKIGVQGVRLKSVGGNLAVRNTGDTADANVTAGQVAVTGTQLLLNTATANTYTLKSPALSASQILTFPATAGTAGQVPSTDGAGNLSWISLGGTSQSITTHTTTVAFGATSPISFITLPANAVVEAVRVIVDTAFNGTPSLSVGVSGSTSKYFASGQVDLTSVAVYEVVPGLAANVAAESLIISYVAGGASVGTGRVELDYVIPSGT